MFTFEKATALHAKFVEFFTAGKIAAALCHGVAILKYAKLPNGEFLAKGRTVTGFARRRRPGIEERPQCPGAKCRGRDKGRVSR